MKKAALIFVVIFALLAVPVWALDSRIYGTYHLSGVYSNGASISYDFTIGYDWNRRSEQGYVYLPSDGNEAWTGADSFGQIWAKATVLDGYHLYFSEMNATAAQNNQAVSGWYDVWFNEKYSSAIVKGLTDVYSPYTYYTLIGTATKQ